MGTAHPVTMVVVVPTANMLMSEGLLSQTETALLDGLAQFTQAHLLAVVSQGDHPRGMVHASMKDPISSLQVFLQRGCKVGTAAGIDGDSSVLVALTELTTRLLGHPLHRGQSHQVRIEVETEPSRLAAEMNPLDTGVCPQPFLEALDTVLAVALDQQGRLDLDCLLAQVLELFRGVAKSQGDPLLPLEVVKE